MKETARRKYKLRYTLNKNDSAVYRFKTKMYVKYLKFKLILKSVLLVIIIRLKQSTKVENCWKIIYLIL